MGGFDAVPRPHVARLNADSTLDMTFSPGTGANATVSSLALGSDGNILIGGVFTTYDGTYRNRLARILSSTVSDTTAPTITDISSSTPNGTRKF